jgi:hypothetical protein
MVLIEVRKVRRRKKNQFLACSNSTGIAHISLLRGHRANFSHLYTLTGLAGLKRAGDKNLETLDNRNNKD